MRRHTIHKLIMTTAVLLATAVAAHAQFADCSTGLLQMPTAEMQEDPTFFITNNFLDKHSLATERIIRSSFLLDVLKFLCIAQVRDTDVLRAGLNSSRMIWKQ